MAGRYDTSKLDQIFTKLKQNKFKRKISNIAEDWDEIADGMVEASTRGGVGGGEVIFRTNEGFKEHIQIFKKNHHRLNTINVVNFNFYLACMHCYLQMNESWKWIFSKENKHILKSWNEEIKKNGKSRYGSIQKMYNQGSVTCVIFFFCFIIN